METKTALAVVYTLDTQSATGPTLDLAGALRSPPPLKVVTAIARPFLKWVGGKTQLLSHIEGNMPSEVKDGTVADYLEPFLGGGSVFFHVAQRYRMQNYIISDNNADLVWAYKIVQRHVDEIVNRLSDLQEVFWGLSIEKRSEMYYRTRGEFNENRHEGTVDAAFRIERTAQLIFLNKTCFNGLYRVNSKNAFNVAFGRYDKPPICDPANLRACSTILKKAQIRFSDFEDVLNDASAKSFVYLDPPYRPISETSNFTSYSASTFIQDDQKRLARICFDLDKRGHLLMLSNSDPKNLDPNDDYFETTYPHFRITTLAANRMVNCKAEKRGKISELLITNY